MAGFGLSSDVEQFEESFLVNFLSNFIGCRIPTVKLKIPGKAFLKSESRTSVTFKLQFLTLKKMVIKFFRDSNFSDFLGIKSEINQWSGDFKLSRKKMPSVSKYTVA